MVGTPHLHNGCFYSGVFYIRADGDEGNIRYIDTHFKVVGNIKVCLELESQ